MKAPPHCENYVSPLSESLEERFMSVILKLDVSNFVGIAGRSKSASGPTEQKSIIGWAWDVQWRYNEGN